MSYVAGECSTYSKMRYAEVEEYPRAINYAAGCYVRDPAGYAYLDTWSALGSQILGYQRVDAAILSALSNGLTNTSLPNGLELDTAEALCAMTGWDQCRFAKNGSDVTEAAVRLARFVTGKTLVYTNSYHGFHSDLGGATVDFPSRKTNGMLATSIQECQPIQSIEGLLTRLRAPDWPVAAVLVEPYHPAHTEPWPWQQIRAACEQAGTLLIFDEIISGFRSAPGGYAQVCGVKPHLACYGKALANGMPLAAICGPRELMRHFEHDVFMSGTAAAEGLSLAAAKACLEVQQKDNVALHINNLGRYLKEHSPIPLRGEPWRLQPIVDDEKAYVGAMAKRGILCGPDIFLTAAHTMEHVKQIIAMMEAYCD